MHDRIVNAITHVAEYNEWEVTREETENGTGFEFSKYTPTGQDFFFYADMEGDDIDTLIDYIDDYIDGYDPDYEASHWIGGNGHGINGAPYRIKDIVSDFESACGMMDDLLEEFRQLRDTMEENKEDGTMCVFELDEYQIDELKQRIMDEKLRDEGKGDISQEERNRYESQHRVREAEVFDKYLNESFVKEDFSRPDYD